MPVVAAELPKVTASSGNSGTAAASKGGRGARAAVLPGSFRQQLSEVASRANENQQERTTDTASRGSRAGPTTPTRKNAKPSQAQPDQAEQEDVTAERANEDRPAVVSSGEAEPAEGTASEASIERPDVAAEDGTPMDDAKADAQSLLAENTNLLSTPVPPALPVANQVTISTSGATPVSAGEAVDALEATTPGAVNVKQAGLPLTGVALTDDPESLPGTAAVTPVTPKAAAPAGNRPATPPIGDGSRDGRDSTAEPVVAEDATNASAEAMPMPDESAWTQVEEFAAAFTADDPATTDSRTVPSQSGQPSTTAITPAAGTATSSAGRVPDGLSESQSVAEPELPVETRFAAANHARIASDVRGALSANGGRMELKLDPPELGALQVSLHLKDGVVTAAFQTQNPEAARLLSHTLTDLRASLEAHGVVVDKLHVQQAPRDEGAGGQSNQGRNDAMSQQQDSRREQQRKEMVQRLWDQLAGNAPIDVRA